MQKIRVAIAGGAGYTGGELLRILVHHSGVKLVCIQSASHSGRKVYEAHQDLAGELDFTFSERLEGDYDVLFLCMGHGASKRFLAEHQLPEHVKLIDFSQDFRDSDEFVYGLPEMNRQHICQASRVANPGCFATAIQLGLLPMASKGLLPEEIHVSAITGSTGAGQKPTETTHFSWRSGQVSVYKAFRHQHLREIIRTLKTVQSDFDGEIHFIPYRGNFTRGILASIYLKTDMSESDIKQLYTNHYAIHPFVEVLDEHVGLKPVLNTNRCFLHVEKEGDMMLVTSAIDNLLKGASGQAVQNMNLMFGLEECSNLHFKASAF
ncbi:MAG: N-acetyl-gamma-glutamyl-phosphate reductase [Calditrichota bacterium]